ncbi:MAG TPA: hypothetical protein DGF30_07465, partial [Desulfomicrobium sp.]|nr:hypothetical protein [Desulfomicrobium sp.]
MIRAAASLTRPGVSLAVGLSALSGWLLATAGAPSVAVEGAAVMAGTFALSAAVSVLNQIQERHLDALMKRTRSRPLASGRMSAGQGLGVFALLLALAAACLWVGFGPGSLAVIFVVLGLYNGLYTYLKAVTG